MDHCCPPHIHFCLREKYYHELFISIGTLSFFADSSPCIMILLGYYMFGNMFHIMKLKTTGIIDKMGCGKYSSIFHLHDLGIKVSIFSKILII